MDVPIPSIFLNQSRNTTTTLGAIPPNFTIKKQFDRTYTYPPEACYINILVAMHDIAMGDWTKKMPIASYRTTKYLQPLIQVQSPRQVELWRAYMAWGLFLVAFYMDVNNFYKLSFFTLMWDDRVIGGIGVGDSPSFETPTAMVVDQDQLSDRFLSVSYEFFGNQRFQKGAVFATLAGALLQAAPAKSSTWLRTTWISFLKGQSCAFVIIPTPVSRMLGPSYFEIRDLLDVLVKAAEYFAEHGTYRQLSMNISVDGKMVAQAAVWHKASAEFQNLLFLRNESISVA